MQHLLPISNELASNEIRDEKSRDQQHEEGKYSAEPGERKPKRIRPHLCGQQEQRLIHELHQKFHNPESCKYRQPHQHPRDEIPSQAGAETDPVHRRALRAGDFDLALMGLFGFARELDFLEDDAAGFFSGLFSGLFVSGFVSAGFESAVFDSPAFASAGFASAGFAFSAVESEAVELSPSGPARLRLDSLSDLKSVSYQPPPFSLKTGADRSFFSFSFEQEGHFRRGGSLIFCMTSV